MSAAAVIGATGGLGGALTEALRRSGRYETLYALGRDADAVSQKDVNPIRIDVRDEASIAEAARQIETPLDTVLIASGLLHNDQIKPEKHRRMIEPHAMAALFAVNATGPALIAKHFLPALESDRRAVFAAVSARVGSIADNRLGGWYGYRASKAALNMIIKTLAVELARTNPKAIAVALHPGTVDTPLSAPFQGNVPDERLFTPAEAAQRLITVIDGLRPRHSGGFFAWDGNCVPF